MKQAAIAVFCLVGASVSSSISSAAPMALDMSTAYNYDAVGTTNEINFVNTAHPTGNHRLSDFITGHNLAQSGRALTTTDSLTSGTALPRYGVVGNFVDSFVYESKSGSNYVSALNSTRVFAQATTSTTVTTTSTITLNTGQQFAYKDLNFLFVQSRSAAGGTYETKVTITYTNNTTAVLDTGAIVVANANTVGGTFGGAGVNSQGGLSSSADSDATVSNVFSSPYGVTTTGASGSFASVISSSAGSNLWQLTTPIALNTGLIPKSVAFSVSAAGTGDWNELVVLGMDATPVAYSVPPATDPAQALNVTFDPSRLAAHPRLLFTPSTLPALKAFYNSPESAVWRTQFNAYIGSSTTPVNTTFLTDATEAQRQAFWRLPTAALAWILTGNQSAFNNALGTLQLYTSLPDWETTIERNSGMAAANNMVGVALAYDWLYNDLDPTFRETVRKKLLTQARALYYGGYLEQNSNISAIYWQVDPLNNHRWHRGAGLALAVMAAFSGDASENWIMNRAAAEAAFVDSYLPPGGTSHESVGYETFGGNHLTLEMQASDDCLGTHLLDAPFFANVGPYHMEMNIASFKDLLDFGDYTAPDQGSYNNFLLLCAKHTHNADLRDGILKLFSVNPDALTFSWFSLLWDDPTLTGGNYQNLPLSIYSGDLGLGAFKDSWTPGGVAAMFKCCPLGGTSLNAYRNANGFTYVNVAHDDPDANSFIIFQGDDNVAASDQYSQRKQSAQQNTILVNSHGQNPVGRTEPNVFSQPGTGDMSTMAKSFPPFTINGATVEEGEAAGSYPAITSGTTRPAISRFRRLFIWSPNKYILSLDDLRSPSSVTFSWLMQGPSVTAVDTTQGLFNLAKNTHTCGFQVVGSQPLNYSIVASTADNKSVSLNYQQLQATVASTNVQIASVFNPWSKTNLRVALQNPTATTVDIAVTATGIADSFRWTYPTSSTTASTLIPLLAPVITSAAPTSPATVNTPYTFTYVATGSPAPTFTVTGGALPTGLSLSTAGFVSGTPTQTGNFTGTVTASNSIGTAATQNFSITINPAGLTFQQWESSYFTAQQMQTADPNVIGPNANPSKDGTVNLLKFIFDINPAIAMSDADRAQLSKVILDTTTTPGITYLALVYRQKPSITGATVNLQTSSDLASWNTVSPAVSKTISTDTATGDPIVEVGVVATGAKQFIRLNVTMP